MTIHAPCHIKNIFEEVELPREGNVQILHIANSDKPVEFYNFDVIISVGYRVKSKRGMQFRIWADGGGSYLYKGGCKKKFMGLIIFAGNQPTLREAVIAKNYLNEKELRATG